MISKRTSLYTILLMCVVGVAVTLTGCSPISIHPLYPDDTLETNQLLEKKINAADAKKHVCEEATVCGTVAEVACRLGREEVACGLLGGSELVTTFLNLEKPFPNQALTVVIPGQFRRSFGPEVEYTGIHICITGLIDYYLEGIAIQVQNPSQIRVVALSQLANSTNAAEELSRQVGPASEDAPHGKLIHGKPILKKGTPVRLRLTKTYSTSNVEVGDGLQFEVLADARVEDYRVIERGAPAWAIAGMGTREARRFGRGGFLNLQLAGTYDVTGDQIALRGGYAVKGQQSALFLHPFTQLFLPFVKGSNASLPKGTKMCGFVDEDKSFDTELLERIRRESEAKQAIAFATRRARALVHIYRTAECLEYLTARETPRHCRQVLFRSKRKVHMDGQEVVQLERGRFLSIELPGGRYTFSTDKSTVELLLKDGEEYYLKAGVRDPRKSKRIDRVDLAQVNNDTGEDEKYPLQLAKPEHIYQRWRSR